MAELETAIETILDSGTYTSTDKIEAVNMLIKERKDDLANTLRTFLLAGKATEDVRVKELENFIYNRVKRNAKQQQHDEVKQKLRYELERPLGERRVNVDDTRPGRHLEDDWRICGINICCVVPRRIRTNVQEGIQWLITAGVVFLVLRYLWYGGGGSVSSRSH